MLIGIAYAHALTRSSRHMQIMCVVGNPALICIEGWTLCVCLFACVGKGVFLSFTLAFPACPPSLPLLPSVSLHRVVVARCVGVGARVWVGGSLFF
jgi:hypothetical protein